MKRLAQSSLLLIAMATFAHGVAAGDWARFRGPNGDGISPDKKPTPVKWSESENLKWKTELPGPGLSSPIVIGDRVFVTCWSGYGVDQRNPGDKSNLKRHIVCANRADGSILWSNAVPAVLPEDTFRGMFAENGYASHTPVSDGERVYVFFGKSGVFAYDLEGKRLWQKSVGTGLGPRSWGSSSSLILYKDTVIVTASAESESMVALAKTSGEEVWKSAASGLSGTWGTPILVEVDDERTDLVLSVPYEIWGYNPDNGKLRWYCEGIASDSMCSSVVAHDGIIYGIESGPRGGGAIAVRAGGKGDVTKSHVVWTNRDRSRVGSPIVHDGHIYYITSKTANCLDAKNGQRVYQSRLTGASSRSGGQGGGFRPGGRGGQDYSSPVVADGKIYYTTRAGDVFVLALGPKFEQLARNRFESDNSDFSATPAISDGQIFIRSNKNLYCVEASKTTDSNKSE